MNVRVRTPIVAGTFYPGRREPLRQQLAAFFAGGAPHPQHGLRDNVGLIAPHAGYIYSGRVAADGFREAAARGRPETIVILGASHTGADPWFAVAPHVAWETPLGCLPIDAALVGELTSAGLQAAEAPFTREHSVEVQLPFIQYLWGDDVPIAPICITPRPLSLLQQAADTLARCLQGRNALVVASSDFTHYQPAATARTLDARALEPILALNAAAFLQTCQGDRLTVCGAGAIAVLLALANHWESPGARLVAYATSGDITGDTSSVVGYASVVITKENHG